MMRTVAMLATFDSILGFSMGGAMANQFEPRSSQVQMRDFRIAPSILSADFARLGEEVENVLAAGADVVHFDVMDNHYVPNLTIGPMVCKALKNYGIKAPIDVHLMVTPVDGMIADFADAGADFITFHPEATTHIDRSLSLVRQAGCKSGLVFNPSTSLDCLKYVMDKVDIILLMSVNPGFGGQAFIPKCVPSHARPAFAPPNMRDLTHALPLPLALTLSISLCCAAPSSRPRRRAR